MAISPEEEQARREAALVRYEAAVDRIHLFVNGDENTVIQTDSGPLPSLRAILKPISEHEAEVDQYLTEITTALENIAPTEAGA